MSNVIGHIWFVMFSITDFNKCQYWEVEINGYKYRKYKIWILNDQICQIYELTKIYNNIQSYVSSLCNKISNVLL